MSIELVAAVPAAPLLLPAASPAQPEELATDVATLRLAVGSALEDLHDVDALVLVAAGDEGVLHDRAVASLRPLGVRGPGCELPVAGELMTALAGRGGYPRGRTDELDGDLAVLTLLCAGAGRTAPVLPVEVPFSASGDALDVVAAGLRAAADGYAGTVGVLAAGDLSAGLDVASPAYRIDGAQDFDQGVVTALECGDHGALRALGPGEAGRVRARGWAPLTIASALWAGPREVRYSTVRGVGQVVVQP